MKYEYILGFNDGLKNTYSNPYCSHKQADLFMLYHNGNNSGCWHGRTKKQIALFN